ncbi:ABC transporter permease [Paenibacillus mendelii]|uniref:ABC transporter permease n=1 Tax=Paenibacillus mendelii TaxID=206163 RepID=A0ABV6J307_9BACL|nr:ABC transporter permease subunit [Paenibacillus mendelii]MCQ6559359.1 ABC transporter permease subunit [Paenibacillus mendelii]
MRKIWHWRYFYLLLAPTLLYFLVFNYIPFYGIVIAFKNFQPFKGVWESPWVGWKNFDTMFSSVKFPELIRNTVLISFYRLLFGFPVPILFALMLNEVRTMWFKRTIQTITYFPHFLSWVVFGGIVFNVIGPSGIVNLVLGNLGFEPLNLAANPEVFRSLVVVTGILKEFGWAAIIYLAALTGIDPHLYEAVKVDGGGKLRQIWHITLPGIRPMIAMLLILQLASILDAGFEQILILSNPVVYSVGDIIDTYVYRVGLLEANYGLATAVGLFKGVIAAVLIVSANHIIRRTGEKSLW